MYWVLFVKTCVTTNGGAPVEVSGLSVMTMMARAGRPTATRSKATARGRIVYRIGSLTPGRLRRKGRRRSDVRPSPIGSEGMGREGLSAAIITDSGPVASPVG